MFTKHVLQNGLTVILAPQKNSKTVTVLAGVRVGSRMESSHNNGLSHFLEHMMFKGTKKRPSTLHISKELDSVGAQYNAFTSKDYTGYYIKASSKYFPLSLDILSDMLTHSTLSATEIERERGVILEEIKMYEDNPLMYIEDVFEESLYEGNTLGWHIIGTRDIIRSLKRADFHKHWKDHYRGENMVLIVAGDIQNQTLKMIRDTFGKISGEKIWNQPPYDRYCSSQREPKVHIFHKKTHQVQAALGFLAYPYDHKDIPALVLLSVILGGNMSSRLFIQVRERRGLAYFVRSSLNMYQDTGSFYVQAGLGQDKLDDALKVILEGLSDVKKNGVTAKELMNAKNYLFGSFDLELEDSSELAQWYFRQELLTNVSVTPEQRKKSISKVTLNDIRRVAQDVFQEQSMNLALIGPFRNSDKKRFQNVLKKRFE